MQRGYRIVVGFDSKSQATHAAAAARLARALGVELEGIFVEEQEAHRLARFPFAVMVEHDGRTRALDPELVRTLLRRAAEVSERELNEAARRERVSVTFRVRQGRFLGELRSATKPRDVIVVGSARIAPRPVPKTGPVAVMVDDPDRAGALLDLGRAIAGSDELIAVLAAGEGARQIVARWASDHPRRVLLRPLAGRRPEELAQAVARIHGRLVLVSAQAFEEEGLIELRRQLGCPLVIV